MRKTAWLPILAFGMIGCSEGEPIEIYCTDIEAYAIAVAVIDSVTNAPLDARDVDATAIDGSYRDSGRPGPLGYVYLARERQGTYQVEIAAPGYAPWVKKDIVVLREDLCHVQTVSLTARMQRVVD